MHGLTSVDPTTPDPAVLTVIGVYGKKSVYQWIRTVQTRVVQGQAYPREWFSPNSNLKQTKMLESWQCTHPHFQILSFNQQAWEWSRLPRKPDNEDKAIK